ncbi:MAG: elongation factor G [Planctomycetaceae bacterium]|nr:elongation factor G [Planctomycetaceae bacterium]
MSDLATLRNIGISAHIDSGKTTLTERILYFSGRIHRMNEVKGDGAGATMDYMDLEKERGITITSACTRVEWEGGYRINIIDTPGHVDFTVEVERSLRVLDGAILVLCAVGGVQSQSLTVDRQMKRYRIPRIAFINKMDRTGANPAKVIAQVKEKLGVTPLPLQLPMGAEARFQGVIDLVQMRAVYFDGVSGEIVRREAIPQEFAAEAKAARAQMLETLSLFSDRLMEALLEEREIAADEIIPLIREATLAQNVTPVMMGTAYKNKGVQELLDAIIAYLPSPLDRVVEATDLSKKAKAVAVAAAVASDAEAAATAGEGDEAAPPTKPEPVKVTLEARPDAPAVFMAFKTVEEPFGQLTFIRIYQGKVTKGDSFTNTRLNRRVRIGRLLRMHADQREDLDFAEAGDIVAAVGLDCASGDTFCGDKVDYALESIFIPEPVIKLSIEPVKREGADKLSKALERFRREDPTFRVSSDEETGQTLIAGMGQLHLEIYVERIRREYKVDCIVGEPRVAYRETPTRETEFNFKHKKQTGGSGQFAHIVGRLVPLPADSPEPYEFEDKVFGGRIPREYIAPVDAGFQRALPKGPLCECEVVNVKMVLEDGSYHDVDSSEMAFNICAFNCMRDTLKKAGIVLLEPIMNLEVEAPSEYQGSISGHLSSKRGIISSSDVVQGNVVMRAEVPLAAMFDYANELRSMTQGKGSFTMEFNRYKQVPKSIQEEVVIRRREEKEQKMAMAR